MKWIIKALLQKAFSSVPQGENINYLFQTRLTKNLPVSDQSFLEKVGIAERHLSNFEQFNPNLNKSSTHFLEFGAGWDLIGPLSNYAFGINNQTVIDIRANIKLDLINNSIQRFNKLKPILKNQVKHLMRSMPCKEVHSIQELKERFGINYIAPCDAANTGFTSNTFDFISTNSTLEHIPEVSLFPILRECKRLLREGGAMSHFIDLKDHYSYFDSSISKYHFLTQSHFALQLFNSSLHYQNRLRYQDYKDIFIQAGFSIVSEEREEATKEDLQILSQLKLCYKGYKEDSLENIGVQILRLVAQ